MIKLVTDHIAHDEELAAKRQRELKRKATINFNFREVAAGIFRVDGKV